MRGRRRRGNDESKPRVRRRSGKGSANPERPEAPHIPSPTAIAAEALRTGLPPTNLPQRKDQISREDDKMLVGDPDDDALLNEHSGEDTPGGSTSTPDQNSVDEIGRAYGLQEEDSGALRSGAEVLGNRDKHRPELRAPRRPEP